MKKKCSVTLVTLLIISILFNAFLLYDKLMEAKNWNLSFNNANSWENYFTVHNIREAWEYGKGEGVKIGILDHYFGCKDHTELYSGGMDFLNDEKMHNTISEHGYWMSCTLKEIAPKCEIYALGTLSHDETKKVEAMSHAINWAIENDIDILTYSDAPIKDKDNRNILDLAVEKANRNGIVTTFIHYDSETNIQPIGMYQQGNSTDLNIYNYDYNLILLSQFKEYAMGNVDTDCSIYYSNSSMSVVTAGFVSILMSINPNLTPAQYKEILVSTSKEKSIIEPYSLNEKACSKVPDIGSAVNYMEENY